MKRDVGFPPSTFYSSETFRSFARSLIGDGAGKSRGITAIWASGIRAAKGILG